MRVEVLVVVTVLAGCGGESVRSTSAGPGTDSGGASAVSSGGARSSTTTGRPETGGSGGDNEEAYDRQLGSNRCRDGGHGGDHERRTDLDRDEQHRDDGDRYDHRGSHQHGRRSSRALAAALRQPGASGTSALARGRSGAIRATPTPFS